MGYEDAILGENLNENDETDPSESLENRMSYGFGFGMNFKEDALDSESLKSLVDMVLYSEELVDLPIYLMRIWMQFFPSLRFYSSDKETPSPRLYKS